jgi:hypothetical protein
VVPKDKDLREKLKQACHDDAMSGHVGVLLRLFI